MRPLELTHSTTVTISTANESGIGTGMIRGDFVGNWGALGDKRKKQNARGFCVGCWGDVRVLEGHPQPGK
jgi:hypothetical protein